MDSAAAGCTADRPGSPLPVAGMGQRRSVAACTPMVDTRVAGLAGEPVWVDRRQGEIAEMRQGGKLTYLSTISEMIKRSFG